MKLIMGAVLFVVGVVLLVLGINASDSLASDVSRFFTGNPTDRAVWMLVLGAGSIVGGIVLAALSRRSVAD
ncbi:MAG: DUF3185 family protein [Phycisphaerales bacterium]